MSGKAWTRVESHFNGVASYLFTAVRHRAYNAMHAIRASERMQHAVRLAAETTEPDPYVDVVLVAHIRREMQCLTDRQRDILRLRYEQGHTMAQAAAILGIDVRAAEKFGRCSWPHGTTNPTHEVSTEYRIGERVF